MGFDLKAPTRLKALQEWFASIITRRIDEQNQMSPISPAGIPMEEESWNYIKPSLTLRPAQRIEIYNQQYWWRLLGILHDVYPLLTRLFGYHDFNQAIGYPYLQKYPPTHWSLNLLGDFLPLWISENYVGDDKKLVYDAASVDWAYNHAFLVQEVEPLSYSSDQGDLSSLLEKTLYLNPAVHLFPFDYKFFNFRREFLEKDPEHWVENEFPVLEKVPEWIVLFRNRNKDLLWDEVSESEYLLLGRFISGSSISDACSWLEDQDAVHFDEATENLHLWLQKWVVKQWLCQRDKHDRG